MIDLEDPWLIPRILPHMSKWEVADVQWSPHIARESWVASTVRSSLSPFFFKKIPARLNLFILFSQTKNYLYGI